MKINKLSLKAVSDAVIHIRRSKLPDPAEIGNAGSFFKNPTIDQIDFEGLRAEFPGIQGYNQPDKTVKVPAGYLIEYCGWKGKTLGKIGVHKKPGLGSGKLWWRQGPGPETTGTGHPKISGRYFWNHIRSGSHYHLERKYLIPNFLKGGIYKYYIMKRIYQTFEKPMLILFIRILNLILMWCGRWGFRSTQ